MKKLLLTLSMIVPLYAIQEATQPTTYIATLPRTEKIVVEVSAGELLDKLTILEIKGERINDPKKLRHILDELRAIGNTIYTSIPASPGLDYLVAQLKQVNEKLWDIEDAIRAKEARQEFDNEFIQISRSVYITNDERGALKQKINTLLGSHLQEEKQYTHYEHQ